MYICIDNMELAKVPHCLVKSSLVFVLVEGGCLAALFRLKSPLRKNPNGLMIQNRTIEIFLRI